MEVPNLLHKCRNTGKGNVPPHRHYKGELKFKREFDTSQRNVKTYRKLRHQFFELSSVKDPTYTSTISYVVVNVGTEKKIEKKKSLKTAAKMWRLNYEEQSRMRTTTENDCSQKVFASLVSRGFISLYLKRFMHFILCFCLYGDYLERIFRAKRTNRRYFVCLSLLITEMLPRCATAT